MAKDLAITALMIVSLAGARPIAAAEDLQPTHAMRVRSTNAAITALLGHAADQSSTFRAMMDTIGATDGIVYVEAGRCGHGVQACLKDVRTSGTTRFVRVYVNLRKTDRELMISIGHELRHAIEVLSDHRVRDFTTLHMFYRKTAISGTNNAFETAAAVAAGEAVRSEIAQFNRRARSGC